MGPHRSVFSQHPLAQLAVAFVGGVCAGNYLAARVSLTLIAGAVCSVVALVLLGKDGLRAAGVALLAAMFFVGAMRRRWRDVLVMRATLSEFSRSQQMMSLR